MVFRRTHIYRFHCPPTGGILPTDVNAPPPVQEAPVAHMRYYHAAEQLAGQPLVAGTPDQCHTPQDSPAAPRPQPLLSDVEASRLRFAFTPQSPLLGVSAQAHGFRCPVWVDAGRGTALGALLEGTRPPEGSDCPSLPSGQSTSGSTSGGGAVLGIRPVPASVLRRHRYVNASSFDPESPLLRALAPTTVPMDVATRRPIGGRDGRAMAHHSKAFRLHCNWWVPTHALNQHSMDLRPRKETDTNPQFESSSVGEADTSTGDHAVDTASARRKEHGYMRDAMECARRSYGRWVNVQALPAWWQEAVLQRPIAASGATVMKQTSPQAVHHCNETVFEYHERRKFLTSPLVFSFLTLQRYNLALKPGTRPIMCSKTTMPVVPLDFVRNASALLEAHGITPDGCVRGPVELRSGRRLQLTLADQPDDGQRSSVPSTAGAVAFSRFDFAFANQNQQQQRSGRNPPHHRHRSDYQTEDEDPALLTDTIQAQFTSPLWITAQCFGRELNGVVPDIDPALRTPFRAVFRRVPFYSVDQLQDPGLGYLLAGTPTSASASYDPI